MTNERYGKCEMCRFCVHSEEDWACMVNNKVVKSTDGCPRWRPGFCENCSHAEISFGEVVCKLTGERNDILSVCDNYDPSGFNSMAGH